MGSAAVRRADMLSARFLLRNRATGCRPSSPVPSGTPPPWCATPWAGHRRVQSWVLTKGSSWHLPRILPTFDIFCADAQLFPFPFGLVRPEHYRQTHRNKKHAPPRRAGPRVAAHPSGKIRPSMKAGLVKCLRQRQAWLMAEPKQTVPALPLRSSRKHGNFIDLALP